MSGGLPLDLDRIRAEGLPISVGTPLTSGRTLKLEGFAATAAGLTDLTKLREFSQVQIMFLGGVNHSIYLRAASLLSMPQIIIGYDEATGCPLLIGVKMV